MRQPKRITPGERVQVALTPRERDLILERTFIDPGLEKRLRLAVVSGAEVVASLTLDDIDKLAGYVAAEAKHCADPQIRRALDSVHDRLTRLEGAYTDQELAPVVALRALSPPPAFTTRQGQYLAFIYYYTKIHGRPPAETDLQRYFRVSPPAVHQMIVTLEARGFIDRTPGQARSIRLRIGRAALPDLE